MDSLSTGIYLGYFSVILFLGNGGLETRGTTLPYLTLPYLGKLECQAY